MTAQLSIQIPGTSIVKTCAEVAQERVVQHVKWGEQNHSDGTGGWFHRMAARSARDSCDTATKRGRVTWKHILEEEVCEAFAESDPVKLRAELVQVAAVAVAWVEALDRRTSESEVTE